MRLTILYDNEATEGLGRGHGFACLVEGEKKILVDTGWDGHLLLSNAEKLGVSLGEVDSIFLSHSHWDHIGGLPTILNLNRDLEVFCLNSFSNHLKGEVKARVQLREVFTATKIADGVYTTGELGGDIKEQSLIVEGQRGNVIVTGCSHPGLGLILDRALKFGNVHGVVGGFHGFDQYHVLRTIRLIVPCHCTQHKKEIKELYPKTCEIGFAGKTIDIQ
jgi:7,8-dihydropterin-6-yl-methyl-4-(beta-D-ribofuranosyl)aminobenzene 5'-phosphate synthase